MMLPKVNSVEFWARETSMPLFWMTDPEKSYGVDSIIIFHDGIYHFYYLNGSDKIRSEGSILKTKEGRVQYIAEANTFLESADMFVKKLKKLKTSKLDETDLIKNFEETLGFLHQYGDLYRHTEEAATVSVAGISPEETEELGRIRFKFKKKGVELFSLLVGKVLKEVSKRYKVSIKPDLFLYTFKELNNLLKNGQVVSKITLNERQRGLAVRRRSSRADIYSGDQVGVIWRSIQEKLGRGDLTTLRGSVAYRGKVVGKVRVVFERRDKEAGDYNFVEGEILVTDMTKPNMISICKKATAIITDEGGILSHASIIARELKKPCIIGTKLATQVFKNGDLVEVDANEGVVRIVK